MLSPGQPRLKKIPRWLRVIRAPGALVRAVERVESLHVAVDELEVEEGGVRTDPIFVTGFRDNQGLVLERPTEHDLRGRAGDPLGNGGDRRVVQASSACERAVCLEYDSECEAVLEEPLDQAVFAGQYCCLCSVLDPKLAVPHLSR